MVPPPTETVMKRNYAIRQVDWRRPQTLVVVMLISLAVLEPMAVGGSDFPLRSPTNSGLLGFERANFSRLAAMPLFNSAMDGVSASYVNLTAAVSDAPNVSVPVAVDAAADADVQTVCETGRWELYLKLACVPFLTLVGLVGNTLSFVVMYSPLYNRKSYSYYLRALAVSDNFNLLITCVHLANEASFQMAGVRLLEQHTGATCKLTEFLCNVIWLVSSWLIVCFTIDRYIAVCHPLQRARLCTETSARLSIALVVLGAMASQLYVFAFVERLDRQSTSQCHAPSELRIDYFKLDIYWFSFTLRFMTPFLIIATCNGLIIFHIKRTRHRRRSLDHDRRYRNSNMAICTLYLVCAVFVATLFPNAIISTILMTEVLIFRRSVMYCRLLVFNAPFQMIRLVNYSLNFVLYGLSGRQFRREFLKLLRCRLHFSGFHDRVREVVMHKIYVNGYRIRSASPSPKTEKSR